MWRFVCFWLQWSRSVLSTQGASARRVPAEGLEEGQSLRTGSSAVRTDSWPGPRALSNESRTPRARCQALSDTDRLGKSKAIACRGEWEGLTRLSVARVRHPGAPRRGFHGRRAKFWGLRSFTSGHQSHHNHWTESNRDLEKGDFRPSFIDELMWGSSGLPLTCIFCRLFSAQGVLHGWGSRPSPSSIANLGMHGAPPTCCFVPDPAPPPHLLPQPWAHCLSPLHPVMPISEPLPGPSVCLESFGPSLQLNHHLKDNDNTNPPSQAPTPCPPGGQWILFVLFADPSKCLEHSWQIALHKYLLNGMKSPNG